MLRQEIAIEQKKKKFEIDIEMKFWQQNSGGV
jgi:hypothetical protein